MTYPRNQFTEKQETWLKALESGAYDQGFKRLHIEEDTDDKHCCLGVADIVCKLEEESESELHNTYDELLLRDGGGAFKCAFTITVEATEFFYTSLINLNDGVAKFSPDNPSIITARGPNYSFAQIAAFIRESPWQVFTNFDIPEGAVGVPPR